MISVLTGLLWLMISLAATHLTFWLAQRAGWGLVRASAFPSLVFAIAVQALAFGIARSMGAGLEFRSWLEPLPTIFFGGTFVGMSHPSRLGERRVLAASAVFAALFFILERYPTGMGGQLGDTAFAASAIVSLLSGRFAGTRPFKRD